ncbi:hypothetical protein D3C71_2202170 [compost metagenome]
MLGSADQCGIVIRNVTKEIIRAAHIHQGARFFIGQRQIDGTASRMPRFPGDEPQLEQVTLIELRIIQGLILNI